MCSSNGLYSSILRGPYTNTSVKELSWHKSITRTVTKQLDASTRWGCITSVQNGIGTIRMLNFKPYPVTLKRNLFVARITFPDDVSSITLFKNNEDQEAQKKFTYAEKPSEKVLESFVAEYKLNLSPGAI